VVDPRNPERNPPVKNAAEVLCRSLEFYLDQTEFDDVMHRVTDDFLVAGLGIPRVKLDAEIEEIPVPDEMGNPTVGEDGEPVTEPVIVQQMVRAEYVPWSRFGWEPATCWEHVEWIYFKHRMSQSEVKSRYGEDASFHAGDTERNLGRNKGKTKSVTVYEIWDKKDRQVIHLAEGGTEPLLVDDDPLGLATFPIPMPLMTNVDYDELTPTPDYNYIYAYDEQLNRLHKRSRHLEEQIKAISIHDASFFELENMADQQDGDSIAVMNVTERMEGRPDMSALIHFFPIEEKARVLGMINQQMDIARRQVDEFLGISDILRGASNPQDGQETQKIKERWAGIRLRRKQVALQHMIRNLFRLMAEVTVKHITRENLAAMTQVPIDEATWAILQSDVLREFSIDIESDSTVARSEFEDKKARTELLQALANYVQVIAPAIMQNMIPADMGKEILQIAITPYSTQARSLEDAIEKMPSTMAQLQQIQQAQGQLQQLQQQMQQKDYALAQYSQADEQRKAAELQLKGAESRRKDQETEAKTFRERVEAAAQQLENQIVAMQAGIEYQQIEADVDKTRAEIDKLRSETRNNLTRGLIGG